jgi:hypothetical protein
VVTIDVMPADAPAEYAPAMVAACSQALPAGSCALAKATPESETPEAVALVLWQGTQFLQVSVRVAHHGGQWTTRNLTFTTRDRPLDRWTTVGLTVATLVGEGQAVAPEPAPPPPDPAQPSARPQPEEPPPQAPKPAARAAAKTGRARPAPAPKSGLRVEVSLGGLLGSAWQGGGLARGLWAGGLLGFAGSPFVAEGFTSYALSDGPRFDQLGELHSKWSSVALGAGLASTLAPVDLRVAWLLEAMFRHVDAQLAGAHASDNELPIRLRALAAWPSRSRVAALLGGALRLPFATTRSSDGPALRQASLTAELQAGLELRW